MSERSRILAYHTQKGVLAQRQDKPGDAIITLRRALALEPRHERTWWLLARAIDKPETQRLCLQNVLALNPTSQRAAIALEALRPDLRGLPVESDEDVPDPEPRRFITGGTVNRRRGIYVTRQADRDLYDRCMEGAFSYVLTARQRGKSSLMVQTANRLREKGIKTAGVDLNRIGADLQSIDSLYVSILTEIVRDLKLRLNVSGWWRDEAHALLTPAKRFEAFIHDVLLQEMPEPLVIFIDEIDAIRKIKRNFSVDDFFALIRSIHNASAEGGIYQRLTFVLLGVARPDDLISDAARTPFNIGENIQVADFTMKEVTGAGMGRLLGLPKAHANQVLAWVLDWTNGHPNLTQKLCQRIAENPVTTRSEVDDLVRESFIVPPNPDSNLKFVAGMLTPDGFGSEVLEMYYRIYTGRTIYEDDDDISTVEHLKLSGIVDVVPYLAGRRRDKGQLVIRNRVYETYFDLEWVRDTLRQRYGTRLEALEIALRREEDSAVPAETPLPEPYPLQPLSPAAATTAEVDAAVSAAGGDATAAPPDDTAPQIRPLASPDRDALDERERIARRFTSAHAIFQPPSHPLKEEQGRSSAWTEQADALVQEAVQRRFAGFPRQARELLERAIKLDDHHEAAWLALANLVETEAERRTCLENVLVINPDNVRAQERLAKLKGEAWFPPPRDVRTIRMPRIMPPPGSASSFAGDRRRRPSPLRRSAGPHLSEARDALAKGDEIAARRAVEAALDADPRSIDAWRLLAELVPNDRQRLTCIKNILHLDRDNSFARGALETVTQRMIAAGQVEAAQAALVDYLQWPIGERKTQLRQVLAMLVEIIGDDGERRYVLELLALLFPEHPGVWEQLAALPADSIAPDLDDWFDTGSEAATVNAFIHEAQQRRAAGDHAGAVEVLNHALRHSRNQLRAWLFMADAAPDEAGRINCLMATYREYPGSDVVYAMADRFDLEIRTPFDGPTEIVPRRKDDEASAGASDDTQNGDDTSGRVSGTFELPEDDEASSKYDEWVKNFKLNAMSTPARDPFAANDDTDSGTFDDDPFGSVDDDNPFGAPAERSAFSGGFSTAADDAYYEDAEDRFLAAEEQRDRNPFADAFNDDDDLDSFDDFAPTPFQAASGSTGADVDFEEVGPLEFDDEEDGFDEYDDFGDDDGDFVLDGPDIFALEATSTPASRRTPPPEPPYKKPLLGFVSRAEDCLRARRKQDALDLLGVFFYFHRDDTMHTWASKVAASATGEKPVAARRALRAQTRNKSLYAVLRKPWQVGQGHRLHAEARRYLRRRQPGRARRTMQRAAEAYPGMVDDAEYMAFLDRLTGGSHTKEVQLDWLERGRLGRASLDNDRQHDDEFGARGWVGRVSKPLARVMPDGGVRLRLVILFALVLILVVTIVAVLLLTPSPATGDDGGSALPLLIFGALVLLVPVATLRLERLPLLAGRALNERVQRLVDVFRYREQTRTMLAAYAVAPRVWAYKQRHEIRRVSLVAGAFVAFIVSFFLLMTRVAGFSAEAVIAGLAVMLPLVYIFFALVED